MPGLAPGIFISGALRRTLRAELNEQNFVKDRDNSGE
jgi:hypothetical protein